MLKALVSGLTLVEGGLATQPASDGRQMQIEGDECGWVFNVVVLLIFRKEE